MQRMKVQSSAEYHPIDSDNPRNFLPWYWIAFILGAIAAALLCLQNVDNYMHDKRGDVLRTVYKTWIRNKAQQDVLILFNQVDVGYRVEITILKICEDYRTSKYINESDWSLIQRERIGPDEILVQLEGASLQSVIALSENQCNKYFAVFQVPQRGRYRLKISSLRSNYDAIKLVPRFPLMNMDTYLDILLPERLGVYLPQSCQFQSINGYWISDLDNISPTPLVMKNECSGNVTDQGSLKISTFIRVSDRVGHPNSMINCSNDVSLYNFKKTACYYPNTYQSVNDIDGINKTIIDVSGLGMTDNTNDYKDFVNKGVLFVGDSHMRGFAELFMHSVCRYRIEDKTFIDQKVNSKVQEFHMNSYNTNSKYDEGCENTTVGYLGAMFCTPDMIDKFPGYQYIIVNCGHHPASQSHYTFYMYRTVVAKLFDSFERKRVYEKAQLFWLENTGPILRQDYWVIVKEDWRTYHRLLLFDAIAKNEMSKKPSLDFGIIPAFYSTLAMLDKMCDCAHYVKPIQIPQVLGFIDAVRFYSLQKIRQQRSKVVLRRKNSTDNRHRHQYA